MTRRVLQGVLIILTAVVLQTAVRIEVLNIRAGSYLPRTDRNNDGSFADGKWRTTQENTQRDQLHGLVETFGLAQYVLAPILLALAVAQYLTSKGSWPKAAGVAGVLVAALAI